MDLDYGEKYESLRDEVRAFIATHRDRAPQGQGVMGGQASEKMLAWQQLLLDRGYAARAIHRAYGGYGGDPDVLETILIGEEFARAGVSAGVSGPGVDMLVPTLLEHGSEEQKKRFVPPTIRGEIAWCQGYSEPGAGSDLASLTTRAALEGDDFVVNGQKVWTTSAHIADMMFALVRTEAAEQKHAGISYLLIPMDAPGIEVRPLRSMTDETEFNQVFLNDVRVTRKNLVGRRGQGWEIANTTLTHERLVAGNPRDLESTLQSLMKVMTAETGSGQRAIEREVFRDRLMVLQGRVFSLKSHAMRLLTCDLREEPAGVAGLVVKLQACELMYQMTALALDAMAEVGGLQPESKHADSLATWQRESMRWLGFIIAGGSAQIQKNIIAERGLGLPREAKPQRQG